MPALSRRRYLTIAACAGALGTRASAAAPEVTQWHATALGARTTLSLAHPDARIIAARVFTELDRLEGIFSLYRADSALSRLNRDGALPAPPFELLECLSLCNRVHNASGGLFDPTVQPLWQAYARHYTNDAPNPADIEQARKLTGWQGVTFDSSAVRFDQPGMAITLNGIAQGYIADRIADMLARDGLRDIMVDTGELRALGGHPQGGGWPVRLQTVEGAETGTAHLRDMAMATSSPMGTRFDPANPAGHILNPQTGTPSQAEWSLISVTGPGAALADGLSTAMCLMDRPAIIDTLAQFDGMRLAHLS